MTKKLTKKQIKEYVESEGTKCPVCCGNNLKFGKPYSIDTAIFQTGSCLDCKSKWTERYEMIGIDPPSIESNKKGK